MTVALWPSLRRLGFRWRLRFDWRHETVRRLLHLARWVVVYVVANQIAYFIIIRLSGRIPVEGAYVVYANAFIFFSLPHAIVAVSIFTALAAGHVRPLDGSPSRRASASCFSRGLRDTEIAMIPAAAGYAVLAGPIAELVASYGHMAAANTALLGRTLAAFAVGLPFFSAFQFLTRTFYATQDAKTPALANIAVAVVNLGADLWLAIGLGLGVVGLALGYASRIWRARSSCMRWSTSVSRGPTDGGSSRRSRERWPRRSSPRRPRGAPPPGSRRSSTSSRPLMRLVQVVVGRCGRRACLRAGRPYLQDPGGR